MGIEEHVSEEQNHKMTMVNRANISMTGIVEVISFDHHEIAFDTKQGLLLIGGEDIHMSHLSLERGEVNVDGKIDSIIYSDAKKMSKTSGRQKGFLDHIMGGR